MATETKDSRYTTRSMRQQIEKHAAFLRRQIALLDAAEAEEVDRVREDFKRERERLQQQLEMFQETGEVFGIDPEEVGHPVRRSRSRLSNGELDPRVQAGPANIEKVEQALAGAEDHEMAQALLAEAAGIDSGRVTWAIKALLLDGRIEDTGKTVRPASGKGRSSRVYRLVQPGANVTTLRPGT